MRFTVIARLQLMVILNEKCQGRGQDRDHVIATSLYNKIMIPDEVQKTQLMMKSRDGSIVLDPDKLQGETRFPDLKIELDFNEKAALDRILNEYEKIRPMDHQLWYDDLIDQLKEAKQPPIEDETTRKARLISRK